MGTPHLRCRLMHQSLRLSVMAVMRACPAAGTQDTCGRVGGGNVRACVMYIMCVCMYVCVCTCARVVVKSRGVCVHGPVSVKQGQTGALPVAVRTPNHTTCNEGGTQPRMTWVERAPPAAGPNLPPVALETCPE